MTAGDRLTRLLALVPYLVARPGVRIADVVRDFAMSERDLRADLDLLFVCGLPGYTPGDLIDVVVDGDEITVSNADAIARPLRLTPDEALALIVAGRTLAGLAGLAERDALDRALAKLETAIGPVPDPGNDPVTVALDDGGATLAALEEALASGRRVHLDYWSAGRDEMTERDVDPLRVFLAEGHWYLDGWCRRVEGVRLFRLDRIAALTVLEIAADAPVDAPARDPAVALFRPGPDDAAVRLRLTAEARWVADYYPCESVGDRPDGGADVVLRAGDLGWVRRLLLRLGPAAEVLDPPELAESVRALAGRALQAYV